MKNFPKINLA
jgi:hypothetical protein